MKKEFIILLVALLSSSEVIGKKTSFLDHVWQKVYLNSARARQKGLIAIYPQFSNPVNDQIAISTAKFTCDNAPIRFSECVNDELKRKGKSYLTDSFWEGRINKEDAVAYAMNLCKYKKNANKKKWIPKKVAECIIKKAKKVLAEKGKEKHIYASSVNGANAINNLKPLSKDNIAICIQAISDYVKAIDKWGKKNNKQVSVPFLLDGNNLKFMTRTSDKKENKLTIYSVPTDDSRKSLVESFALPKNYPQEGSAEAFYIGKPFKPDGSTLVVDSNESGKVTYCLRYPLNESNCGNPQGMSGTTRYGRTFYDILGYSPPYSKEKYTNPTPPTTKNKNKPIIGWGFNDDVPNQRSDISDFPQNDFINAILSLNDFYLEFKEKYKEEVSFPKANMASCAKSIAKKNPKVDLGELSQSMGFDNPFPQSRPRTTNSSVIKN